MSTLILELSHDQLQKLERWTQQRGMSIHAMVRAFLDDLAAYGTAPDDYDVTQVPFIILPLLRQERRTTCHSRRITTSTESGSDERSLRRHGVAESLSSTKGRHSGYSHHTLSVIAHSWARYVTSNYEDHRQENTPNILGTIPV